MKILMDNRHNLTTVLTMPGVRIHSTTVQDKFTSRWIYDEICYSGACPNYYWNVMKLEFDTEEELQSYVVLRKLEW